MPDYSAKSNHFISRGQIFSRVARTPARITHMSGVELRRSQRGSSFVSSLEQRTAH